jgi:GMP synthase-like glutamine amidotransferase
VASNSIQGHSSFDDDPWILRLVEFVKGVLNQDRVRIIGVCFGHQIVGRALGLPVGRNDNGWEVSVLPIDLTEFGAELIGRRELVRSTA